METSQVSFFWNELYSNELGRLCQSIDKGTDRINNQQVKGTDTFKFIHQVDVPVESCKAITYNKFVGEVCFQNSDLHPTCITIGGNRICYPGDIDTLIVSLELVKIIINIGLL